MEIKCLEVRDDGTFIPMLCVEMNVSPLSKGIHYLLRRCGYPCDRSANATPNIAMTPLDAGGKPCWNDPCAWGGRTFPVAHHYIIEHWHELLDGDVVDVQFILGETKEPKRSERETVPLCEL